MHVSNSPVRKLGEHGGAIACDESGFIVFEERGRRRFLFLSVVSMLRRRHVNQPDAADSEALVRDEK